MPDRQASSPQAPALSVVIPARNEAASIADVIHGTKHVCDALGVSAEVLVVDGLSTDDTLEVAQDAGARVIVQEGVGYGRALQQAFSEARGEWVATLDADLSHSPNFLRTLWKARHGADLLIASRYVPGGHAEMPTSRYLLSRIVNGVFAQVLAMPYRDLSSGYRLYRRASLRNVPLAGNNFDFLQRVAVQFECRGYVIRELPFFYQPRLDGVSNARVFRFGVDYLKALWSLHRLRISVASADYDFRAFHSRNILQRWWQRRRFRIVSRMVGAEAPILDIGAGSGVFAATHPGVVALDASHAKLRVVARHHRRTVCADSRKVPLADESFPVVVCSHLIEHLSGEETLDECVRLVAPGGTVVVSTPDYGRWRWPLIEKLYGLFRPGGYANEHINRFTLASLTRKLQQRGLVVAEVDDILGAEITVRAQKPRLRSQETAAVSDPGDDGQ